jgi:hypothetical protein
MLIGHDLRRENLNGSVKRLVRRAVPTDAWTYLPGPECPMHIGGIETAVASRGFWAIAGAIYRRLTGQQIKITFPRSGEVLDGKKPLGKGFSYEVRGKLKHLPKGHEIWLLVRDEFSTRVWPQGFERVQFDSSDGSWRGRINPALSGPTNVTIIAVVAPPTSRDFFQYFQRVGDRTRTMPSPDGPSYEPLARVPPECTNVAEVQAKKP